MAQAWGNRFWAMEYGSFNEVDLPDGTVTESNPIHRLDFYRFSSDQTVSYNALQVSCVAQHSPKRFITHNFMMMFFDLDAWKVGQHLDFCTYDRYSICWSNHRQAPNGKCMFRLGGVLRFAPQLMGNPARQLSSWIHRHYAGACGHLLRRAETSPRKDRTSRPCVLPS